MSAEQIHEDAEVRSGDLRDTDLRDTDLRERTRRTEDLEGAAAILTDALTTVPRVFPRELPATRRRDVGRSWRR